MASVLDHEPVLPGPDGAGPGAIPVEDVVVLDDRKSSRPRDPMAHRDDRKWTAASLLEADVGDARVAFDRVAHLQRLLEVEPAPAPHALRQRHRRQESATPGVTVRTDFALLVARREEYPVPQRWHLGAGLRLRVVAVQRGRQRGDGAGTYLVHALFAAAQPLPPGLGVERHQDICRQVAAWEKDAADRCLE